MPALTPIYGFYLPTVGGDGDVWGGFLDSNWSQIDGLLDTAINSVTDSVSSGPITITDADRNKLILVDATAGPITVNFSAAALLGDGFKVSIKKVDISANAVILDPSGSETIDGDATYSLATENAAATIGTDGSNLFIISTKADVGAASTTTAGIVRLATVAETQTGTDATIAVTPAGLTAAFPTLLAGSIITPTMQVFTTPGAVTWSRPSGCKKIKITNTAAGGGSFGGSGGSAGDGGNTNFGTHCSATGGKAGTISGGGVGGDGTGGDLNISGSNGGQQETNSASQLAVALGGSSFLAGSSTQVGKNNGGGAGMPNITGSNGKGYAGGGGGTSIKYIDVTAINSVSLSIGTGGTAGGGAGSAGGSGAIIVEEYYA